MVDISTNIIEYARQCQEDRGSGSQLETSQIIPLRHRRHSPIERPTIAEYESALRENIMLTSSPIAPCNRCKWPRVAECACNYCGSVRP